MTNSVNAKLDTQCGWWRDHGVIMTFVTASGYNTALFHTKIQRLIVSYLTYFNKTVTLSVTGELKCRNLYSKYLPFSLTQARSRIRHCLMTESRHSVAITLSPYHVNFIWFTDKRNGKW